MPDRVRIPRLPNRRTDQNPGRRIARACDGCRSRKSKCNGHRPICGQCASSGLESCVYSDPKRSREQKALESSNEQVARYESILREISHEVDEHVAKKIKKALPPSPNEQASKITTSPPCSSSGSSISFLEALDVLDEDINRSKVSRATGYLGRSSEVAWMRSLEREVRGLPDNELGSNNSRTHQSPVYSPISAMNYHVEFGDYPGQEDENIYALPAKALAERLLRLYLDSVQPSLPIIRRVLFLEQFHSLYSGELIYPGRKWLAVLNLIFAISSKLCQNSGQDIQNRDYQFYSRAHKLNISESLVEGHEDLQQIQVETLAAFYLLTSSQINRAWKMIGVASRSSIALGLNLRAMHNTLDAPALEARHNLWWSIFILENILSVMTGRASGLVKGFCSAPPPLPSVAKENIGNSALRTRFKRSFDNISMKWTINQQRELLNVQRASMNLMDPTDELYFFCLADLAVISHTASAQIYSTDAVEQRRAQVKSRVEHYNRIMEDWRSGLPDSMGFEGISAGQIFTSADAYKVSLAMHYYSSRIVLNRPCLAYPRKGARSHFKTQKSGTRKEVEPTCLHSALAILSLFPTQPDPVWVSYVPWWNALHFLVQATTILLISISLDCLASDKRENQSFTNDSKSGQLPELFESSDCKTSRTATRKALRWLDCLGQNDNSARRAFDICNTIIRRIAPGCFDMDEFSLASTAATVPYLVVPSDETHQQFRSKLDVPYSQFAGTGDFGYDCRSGTGEEDGGLQAMEGSDFPSLGVDMDAPGYVFDAEYATLDEALRSLASPDYEPM